MLPVLQVDNRSICVADLIGLLAGYRLLPQLRRELLIDGAIAQIELRPEEVVLALGQFVERNQLTGEAELRAWLTHYGMTLEQLEALAVRELKIEKFKIATWGHRLEAYFLTQKSRFDRILYSIIRTSDAEIAQELYFRIIAGEQSFAELAREYSSGEEAQGGGLVGPVEMSQVHPTVASLLSTSQPGQPPLPTKLEDWFCIVRLEKLLPAKLDDDMRQQLALELFEDWLQSKTISSQELVNALISTTR